MQVLLNEDVKKLGYRGDIVDVKNGYFRNFLYPRGLAQVATDKIIKLSEVRNEKRLMKKQQVVDNAKDVLKKLKGLKVTLNAKVSKKGKLYGSISEAEVIEALKETSKIELEKDFIKMDHIKDLGEHKIVISFGEGLEEEVIIDVVAAS